MIDRTIEILLIVLLIFTPIAFGSQVLWAYSLMELGILLIIILWAIQGYVQRSPSASAMSVNKLPTADIHFRPANNYTILVAVTLLSLFLGLVLLQMIPLPSGIIRTISPKTYDLRCQLSVTGLIANNESSVMTLSLFPFATKVEFFKWLSLVSLFLFLLSWRLSDPRYRITRHLILAVFLMGAFESLYGMFEFFSGHGHILNLDYSSRISSVTGTFFNRNCLAGYLLMAIPLSVGFFFSREVSRSRRVIGLRHRISRFDGKDLLVGFGLVLMILGLLLTGSRGGIVSLLIAFSLMAFLFRSDSRKEKFSRTSLMVFGLALLWAVWIGVDAVVSRFFAVSEGFEGRWLRWVDTWSIFKNFPLFGSGLGTFTEVFSMYRSFHIRGLDIQAENDFLQLSAEVGILGVVPLLILFVLVLCKAVSGIRSLPSWDPQRHIGIGALVGILGLMFHSIVQKNLQLPANAFLYTVTWAIVLRAVICSGGRRSA